MGVSDNQRMAMWTKMTSLLNRHNKYIKEGRDSVLITELYWQCMGMLEAAKCLDIFDMNQLKVYENKLYKAYEKRYAPMK